ncbi:PRC-barrel domain-containing protein [Azospirillum sp. SYSU D00513]|uniref:PRC-barrel domain-containing protein n=1 Tax=Azospirillum sp. SYSU D00513 TaxID=2812561 RepID=UPI001A960AF4|nr:PRC-barrel domain-containing protein [Azospirillum sp. SYSU D00513]
MRKGIVTVASALMLMSGATLAQTTMPSDNGSVQNNTTMGETKPPGTDSANMSVQAQGAEAMLGKTVYGRNNEEIGEVEDVILGSDGQPEQIVVSSGGFLGIGEKQIGIAYDDVDWDAGNERLQASSIAQQDVGNMPEFQYTDTMTSLERQQDSK